MIEERIATGGFGAVYRARMASGLPVAVKLLHRELTGDPAMVARFQREGAILTQLHDPHTVTTFAVGETSDGTYYIAMELLAGESLHARLARDGALPWPTAAAIARAVCSSLAEAHALGVVHRDLKPANIQVDRQGGDAAVKVIDFGIVKVAPGSAIDDGQELTHLGHLIGTTDYMSPEQIIGGACDAAADLYSLGVVLYEMLTGRRPYAEFATPAAMLTALVTEAPRPPATLAAIPPVLDQIVMRCLEREPLLRFTSARELAAALDHVLDHAPDGALAERRDSSGATPWPASPAPGPHAAAPRRTLVEYRVAPPDPPRGPAGPTTLPGVAVAPGLPSAPRRAPPPHHASAPHAARRRAASPPVARARPRIWLVVLCAAAVALAGIAGYLLARVP